MSKDSDKKSTPATPKAPTLYFIAGFKLLKGVIVLLLAAGIFALSGHNLGDVFDNVLRWVHLDPEKRFFAAIGDQLDTYTPRNLRVFASGTMIYGLFLFGSGLGLALRASWAIWLAIGESAFFIPIEIFEIIRRHQRRFVAEYITPVGGRIFIERLVKNPHVGRIQNAVALRHPAVEFGMFRDGEKRPRKIFCVAPIQVARHREKSGERKNAGQQ